jgi:hypothetical protein
MSNFKVEFTLKQHTSIIHFQSDQSGATLRATELKPKFDRFLLEYVENVPFIKNANKHKSIDYKVKIEQNLSSPQNIDPKNPLFFGNMGDGVDKLFKQISNSFKIIFFTFNKDIKNIIEENFESFLANTNFGTRQSKGFGSFYINKSFDKNLIKHKVYSFESSNEKYQEDIKIFYSFLRAGINNVNGNRETVFYTKALIFAYAKSQNITWDKKAIKEKYLGNELKEQQVKHEEKENCIHYESSNKYLMRDLFGLSTEQSWKSYHNAKITKENKEIARFKSPITFKPIVENNRMWVYFWADNSVEKILNSEFLIKVNRNGDLKLKTPTKFSFDEFFNFALNLDLSKHIDTKFHTKNEYMKLSKIFKDLKASL